MPPVTYKVISVDGEKEGWPREFGPWKITVAGVVKGTPVMELVHDDWGRKTTKVPRSFVLRAVGSSGKNWNCRVRPRIMIGPRTPPVPVPYTMKRCPGHDDILLFTLKKGFQAPVLGMWDYSWTLAIFCKDPKGGERTVPRKKDGLVRLGPGRALSDAIFH